MSNRLPASSGCSKPGDEQQLAALRACQRWLCNFVIPPSSKTMATGMIFHGETFTPQETEAIERSAPNVK